MEKNFDFRPLTPGDFHILTKWHSEPHIIEAWRGRRSPEEVKSRYTAKLAEEHLEMFIICLRDRPIGFIQAYKAADVKNGWWPDEPETTWGIDLFIGEPDCLNKGLGSALIRRFSDDLLARPKVEKVITDPAPSNKRSIKAFKNAGFIEVGPTATPDGEAILLEKI